MDIPEHIEAFWSDYLTKTARAGIPPLYDVFHYLVTQSNVIATVEGGKESIGDVRQWLTASVTPFFADGAEAKFLFRGPIWYLRPSV
jgi:hypothetical protein